MIIVKVIEDKKQINNVVVKGHAGYDESGKDIVCAAVSACVFTTINAILSINEKVVNTKQEENKILINKNYYNDTINKLLLNMLSMLSELEQDYPKYIKIMRRCTHDEI